ncbi:MAG TPA: hypothetical protein PKK43_05760, partial [Spirochaetota bacterium]|nr:hypothetical protein [Spirochaetota bacterium]
KSVRRLGEEEINKNLAKSVLSILGEGTLKLGAGTTAGILAVSGIKKVSYFISQEQVAAIRGWGKFMPAHQIAEVDDSGIVINGPIENEDMRKMHQDFWTTGSNSGFKHSIHLSDGKISDKA